MANCQSCCNDCTCKEVEVSKDMDKNFDQLEEQLTTFNNFIEAFCKAPCMSLGKLLTKAFSFLLCYHRNLIKVLREFKPGTTTEISNTAVRYFTGAELNRLLRVDNVTFEGVVSLKPVEEEGFELPNNQAENSLDGIGYVVGPQDKAKLTSLAKEDRFLSGYGELKVN